MEWAFFMKYTVRNILIPISQKQNLIFVISKKLKIPTTKIKNIEVVRRSIDARKKINLKYNYTILAEIDLQLPENSELKIFTTAMPFIQPIKKISNPHPFIIGAGPAGLFAAYSLVENGFQPYIFERGDDIDLRAKKVNEFWRNGKLDEESNVQFGEGGAGTFSDGKLTARTRDFYTNKINDILIKFGADEIIKYDALPHLGTDKIRKIVKNMRTYLISKGCKFFWNHKLEDITIEQNKLTKVVINGDNYEPEILILAIGNSARDTFSMLHQKIELENKSFAVGIRIEHKQKFINEKFFGKNADISLTGPANYRLTAKHQNRGIYSFCMCPGGYVVAASSEAKKLVLNGMSFQSRDNKFANSAIVVTVDKRDFGENPLAGIEFQRQIEKKCYNHEFRVPFQTATDFLKGRKSEEIFQTSYKLGLISQDISEKLPANIVKSIKYALQQFDKRIPNFSANGNIFAPETRTSSPVRILRDRDNLCSTTAVNVYPIGEGSGYAGGIMSSAADGYKLGKVFF